MLAQVVRFTIVGGFSTAVFMLAQYLLIGRLGVSITAGTTVSFAVSIVTSYFGHHAITFQRSGAHVHYGARFAVVTALMLVISNLMAYAMVTVGGLNYLGSSVIIALVYPAGSFVLQNLWVFSERSVSRGRH